jgi:hypothetical protein
MCGRVCVGEGCTHNACIVSIHISIVSICISIISVCISISSI